MHQQIICLSALLERGLLSETIRRSDARSSKQKHAVKLKRTESRMTMEDYCAVSITIGQLKWNTETSV
jgi:hypothetical protein